MTDKQTTTSLSSLVDLPVDELVAYGCGLGLQVEVAMARDQLLAEIRKRQELLVELDREALLDVVKWDRLPVRKSAGKEELAKQIATIKGVRLEGLSDRGLRALARLRGVAFSQDDARRTIEQRVRRQGGFWAQLQRKRRSIMGSLIGKIVERPPETSEYRFLPDEVAGPSLKETIQDAGVVGGIAQKLRGAADDYIHEKLNEIEQRIDAKLSDIDRQLGSWRDQEIRNRLRLIRITLIAAVIVAALSLGYDYLKARSRPDASPTQPIPAARHSDPAE